MRLENKIALVTGGGTGVTLLNIRNAAIHHLGFFLDEA